MNDINDTRATHRRRANLDAVTDILTQDGQSLPPDLLVWEGMGYTRHGRAVIYHDGYWIFVVRRHRGEDAWRCCFTPATPAGVIVAAWEAAQAPLTPAT